MAATQTQNDKDYYHIIPDYFQLFFTARQANKKTGPKKKQTRNQQKNPHNLQTKNQTETVTVAGCYHLQDNKHILHSSIQTLGKQQLCFDTSAGDEEVHLWFELI